ncbi:MULTISPECIES: helicase-associated domain-containing protein [unclassified Luteococcus]|uniref:helicase-associated domain-containing protein n=1 Tax=unclassified Luteococcus TaxID=2639923 RepID=UPI00313A903D
MSGARSIADVIRAQSAAELADLVSLRPDLAIPRPQDLSELIERALGPASTQLALEGLDAWQRRVALALAACPDAISTRRLAALMAADRGAVDQAVRALRRRALVWGSERSWHLTRSARTAFGHYPAGLAGESSMPLSDAEIDAALSAVGEPGRQVLERLLWANPTGRVAQADRRGSAHSPRPVDQLLFHKLVRPLDSDTIVLPREVALRLRGGRLFDDEVPAAVPPWPAGGDSRLVDQAGLGSAFELVSTTEVLIDALGRMQPRPLATGGLAKRDLTALSREAGGAQRTLFLLLVAERAGLIANAASAWLPTHHFDQWLELDGWQRWQRLRDAWLALDSLADAAAPALAPGNTVAWAGALRRLAASQVQAAAPGAPVEAERLAERIAWLRPAWATLDLEPLCRQFLTEFGWFGLVALGKRSQLADADEDPGFPQPVTDFVIQSDLTAVTPAPLRADVGQVMGLLAQRESSGGAGVYRFTADSVRRGLDAGWTADEIRAWITEHSITPVPQSLSYLVDDVARKHGQVQVSAVASVVTVDDPVTVDAILGHPDARVLGLRKLAPTVLAAAAEPVELVAFLRDMGLAPVAQDATGSRYTTPPPRRARTTLVPLQQPAQRVDAEAVVAELLARDEGRKHALAAGSLLTTLTDSIGKPGWWRLEYVANDGTPQSAEVRVLALSGGTARLMKKAEGPFTLPVSRMVSVRPA